MKTPQKHTEFAHGTNNTKTQAEMINGNSIQAPAKYNYRINKSQPVLSNSRYNVEKFEQTIIFRNMRLTTQTHEYSI